jgi:uncharacterized repeat protein (TIGR01451 family)
MKLNGMATRAIRLQFEFTQDFIGTCADVRPGHSCGVWFDNVVMKSATYTLADLSITKTLTSGQPVTGTNVSYAITVANNGPTGAFPVSVADNLPPSLSVVSCAASGLGRCMGTGLGTLNFEAVPSGTTTPFSRTNPADTTAATFSSPDGAVFSVGNSSFNSASGFNSLSGRTLSDNDATPHRLDILFNPPLQSINLVFALNTAAPGNTLNMEVLNGTDTVDNVTAPGLFPGNGFAFPEGSISFSGHTFDQVRLTSTAQDFAIDDVNTTAAGAAPSNVSVNFAGLSPGTQRTITLVAALSCATPGGTPLVNAATINTVAPDPDMNNNFSTSSAVVVNPAPTITCPADITTIATLGSSSKQVTFALPTASDNCSLPPDSIVTNPVSGSSFPIGPTLVTGTVTDSGGRSSQCSFNVSVNAPTGTTISASSGQYSDVVTLMATVGPTSFPGQTISGTVAFFVNGASVGSSPVNALGAAVLSYTITQGQGTYNVTANFISANPFFVNSSGIGSLTVSREDAIVTPAASNPDSVQVTTPGGTATVSLSALITEVADGSLGDISKATPVTFTLTPVGPGSPLKQTVAAAGGGPGGAATATATFTNVAVNVYEVSIEVGGEFYRGSAEPPVLVVFDPSLGFTTGGGTITHNGSKANFGFNFNYDDNGKAQGNLLYVEHRPTGNLEVKSDAVDSIAIVDGQAFVLGKATVNDAGNYSFRLTAIDSGESGEQDQFGLEVTDTSGNVVGDLTFTPINIDRGNVQVTQP